MTRDRGSETDSRLEQRIRRPPPLRISRTEREREGDTHSRDRRDYFRDMVAASLSAVARRIHNSGSSSGNDSSLSAKSAGHHAYVHARILCISPRAVRPTHARITLVHTRTTRHSRAGAYAAASARCSFVRQSRLKSRISH